jgi:chorismate mutase/prephenate dehydratase
MPSSAQSMSQLREKISDIDEQVLNLLGQRKALTTEVAEKKIESKAPVRDSQREHELLLNLVKKGQAHKLDAFFVTKLFQLIIEDSVLTQQHLITQNANKLDATLSTKVAFLGDKGSYSYLATHRYFSRRDIAVDEIGCDSFRQVFGSVESNEATYAALPVENTSSGSINEVYDLLQHTDLSIVGEIIQPVEHAVLVSKKTELSNIKALYGHPQVFAQSSNFIETLNDVEIHPTDSTSAAMQLINKADRDDIAAIGSEAGGNLYQLTAIEHNIANQAENHSRFIIVAKHAVKVPLQVPAKTTLVMSIIQKPGALVDALSVLRDNEVNMTKLESRPIPGNPWEEMFYLDIDGNIHDGPVQKALEDLTSITRYIKVLGCYPIENVEPTKVSVAKALADEKN